MPGLFGRQVYLEIGPRAGGRARVVRDLRIAFRVVQTSSSGPFEATIDVFNPAPETVAAARNTSNQIRLLAGYDTVGTVFVGHALRGGVRVVHRGPDRVMTIDAQDGWRALADAKISKTYTTRTTAQEVVDEVVAQAGLPRGIIRIPGTFTFENGVVLHGSARRILDELTETINGRWAIVDGALELHDTDEPTVLGQRGPHVSVAAGNLIGSPTVRTDEAGVANYEVRSLLLPSMRPWRPFRLTAEDLRGDLVARDVVHQGDSGWDSAFYTDIVARQR